MTNRINVMYAGYIVETATTLDLFATPSHPYTIGLLHSIPRVDALVGEPLIPIEGRPPDMRRAPTFCRSPHAAAGGSTSAGRRTRRCDRPSKARAWS